MKKYFIKKITSSVSISMVLALVIFPVLEPKVSSAVSDEVVVNLTVDSGISITSPSDVTMSNMGVTTNNSTGGATWNVKTNDPDGYTLGVKASTTPAMRNATHSFADYTEATPGTPDTWSVNSGNVEFGFSAYGTDVEVEYGSGSACDNGAASSTVSTTLKFEGFTTSDEPIATRSATTTTSGVDTRVCFAAGQNGVYAPAGLYQASITATATVL